MSSIWTLTRRCIGCFSAVSLFFLLPGLAFAQSQTDPAAGHGVELVGVMLALMIIAIAGRFGADLAVRFKQPEVLGELAVGILLGNLVLFGIGAFEFLKTEHVIEILSQLGVVFLLFQVGLETDLHEMKRVGWSALLVATLGVVVPTILGYFVAMYFAPHGGSIAHLFVGATLCATSVGITARVFKEMGVLSTSEAKIVLGAAVIDDVMGLLVLSLVTGIVHAANGGIPLDVLNIARIVVVSCVFLFGAIFLGRLLIPHGLKIASFLKAHGVLLIVGLGLCLGFSCLAALAGLAPIVGAFAAGLVLDPVHYRHLEEKNGGASLEDMMKPLVTLFAPIFFVMMGVKVDLSQFADSSVLVYAISLTLAAIVGKQICGYGVLEKGVDRILVGFGMIPRGEVGLIFASQGAVLLIEGERVINSSTYGAVVFMVLVTTMISPILLGWKLNRVQQ